MYPLVQATSDLYRSDSMQCTFQRVAFCICAALVLALQLWPFDANLRSVPNHSTFIIRMPEVDFPYRRTQLDLAAQHHESMCKAFQNKEFLLVFSRQCYTISLTISFRITSQVNCNIEYCAVHHADQLALQLLLLKIQTTITPFENIDGLSCTKDMNASFLHILLVVGFHTITTGITVNSRFNHAPLCCLHFSQL